MNRQGLIVRRARAIATAVLQWYRFVSLGRMAHVVIRRPLLALTLCVSVSGCLYWVAIASDRYVSEARIVVQRTDIAGAQGTDLLGGLLGGGGPGRNDQMLLREHLLSLDMTARLEADLGLAGHYSQSSADFLSRMWWREAPLEWLHRHFLSRVRVEFDEYSGVLSIQVQAYSPQMAQAIARLLVSEGERFMNRMAHDLAQAQVDFLQGQVARTQARMLDARSTVLSYQNAQGLISPRGTAENVGAVISRLEGQRSELNVQRAALTAYLVADHSQVVQLTQQIAALDRQIQQEQARLASPRGASLNQKIEQFQRLEAEAVFANDLYRASLTALEKGQIDANRTVKKVSVLQAANLPQYPLEPRRLYNATVFVVLAALAAGTLHLILAIVRDHRD
jgi:capsular polysaccharide transport system permease protein